MAVDIDRHYADYVSKVGKKTYCQQCLKHDSEVWNMPTNAVYAVVSRSDELIRSNYYICYGKLNEWESYSGEYPEAIFLQLQSPLMEMYGITNEMAYDYYSWLFNLSPYAGCFITKDVTKALADRVVVLTAHIDSSLLIGACSAVRLPWESYYRDYYLPSIVKLWHKLIMEGSNPDIAMVVANNFSINPYDAVSIRGGGTAGHQPLSVNRANTILNFPVSNFIRTEKFSKTAELDEDVGITGIWNKDNLKSTKLGELKTFFSHRILGVSGKQVNPFSVSASSTEYKLPAVVEGLTVAIKDIQTILET